MINLYLYENLLQALEFAEMDGNFKNLRDAIYALIALNPNNLSVSQAGGANKILATNVNNELLLNLKEAESSLYVRNLSGYNRIDSYNSSLSASYPLQINSSGLLLNINDVTAMILSSIGANIFGANAAGGGGALSVTNSSTTPGGGCLVLSNGTNNDATGYFVGAGDVGGWRMYILGNGNLQNLNNSYGGISDVKLKTNIEDSRSYLTDLCDIKIRKYNFKSDPDGVKQLGVVAQELENIFPGLIEETPDRAKRQEVIDGKPQFEQRPVASNILGLNGQPIITHEDDPDKPIMETYLTGESTKSVKYSIFVPMLITAVQELKAQNDALEARLAALEEKVAV